MDDPIEWVGVWAGRLRWGDSAVPETQHGRCAAAKTYCRTTKSLTGPDLTAIALAEGSISVRSSYPTTISVEHNRLIVVSVFKDTTAVFSTSSCLRSRGTLGYHRQLPLCHPQAQSRHVYPSHHAFIHRESRLQHFSLHVFR